ncbi:MAG: hypothetical protein COV46_05010 [Deltaproteobacteria bacterium CG11_big_fil_rev_8_21_14_0_20_49_13]|nr:MAG: hypothetical protein COV46_05010 [Deltaproteobacteria bacterium CG11_big_fil_rev_8_21_14_0_20_49_13]
MSVISNIRERLRKVDVSRGSSKSTNSKDLPLDHQLTFDRNSSEKWNYRDGHIYLNDEDIEVLLDESRDDVGFQSAVSDAISEYKDVVWKKDNASYQKFVARAESVQDRILFNMKRIYDEKTGGIRISWGDGGYLVNNINVRAILALYHIRPTDKARKFLSGLKSKLALILVNKNGSSQYERINHIVKTLYCEVDDALNQAPVDVLCLPPSSGHSAL